MQPDACVQKSIKIIEGCFDRKLQNNMVFWTYQEVSFCQQPVTAKAR